MVDWFVNFAQTQFGVSVILGLVLLNTILGSTSWLIYAERKVAAFIQDRKGPNRVGPFGLIQPIADGIKMVFKEDSTPDHVDKPMFLLAPLISFMVGMITFAAIPWGGQWDVGGELLNIQVSNPDIGVLYILGVASVGVYGVVLGGWASNNKYSFLAAMRATAQMLSYEIPLGVCILVMVLTAGTLRLEDIVAQQVGDYWFGVIPQWNIFLHPIAFVVLFIAMLAEANRAPFDLAEAEQELVGGFHTEYGALKFGLFFLGEYAAMITSSALLAVLFFGGWHLPWLPWGPAGSDEPVRGVREDFDPGGQGRVLHPGDDVDPLDAAEASLRSAHAAGLAGRHPADAGAARVDGGAGVLRRGALAGVGAGRQRGGSGGSADVDGSVEEAGHRSTGEHARRVGTAVGGLKRSRMRDESLHRS
jgi:NADH-quinone oxidoreductase subunit H